MSIGYLLFDTHHSIVLKIKLKCPSCNEDGILKIELLQDQYCMKLLKDYKPLLILLMVTSILILELRK